MTDVVPHGIIEDIVGARRHPELHIGRAVTKDRRFYILHSQECLLSGRDLRDCEFSIALDDGIDEEAWADFSDVPVFLDITWEGLVAVGWP